MRFLKTQFGEYINAAMIVSFDVTFLNAYEEYEVRARINVADEDGNPNYHIVARYKSKDEAEKHLATSISRIGGIVVTGL